MKRVYEIGRALWLGIVSALAVWVYFAADKIVGSHWFAGGLTAIFLFFAYFAGAPGIPWHGSWLKFRHSRHWIIKSIWRTGNLFALALTIFSVFYVCALFAEIEKDMPSQFDAVSSYHPLLSSRVYSRDGQVIGEFFIERRVIVDLKKIPRHVQLAFVAAEDKRFYSHHGIDLVGIARAAHTNFKAGKIKQGGSTITQQIAKLLITGNEKSVTRKMREAILARKIEKTLSKDQILAIYLNHAYLGHGAYGVAAAAEIYFGKDVGELTLAEASLIAGAPKAPGANSPFSNFPRAKERQGYVLREMVDAGFISPAEEKQAAEEIPVLVAAKDDANWAIAPYFVEHVRKYLYRKYGKDELFGRGLQIYTTLDVDMQQSAEQAVHRGLEDLSRRLGFSGPIGRVETEKRAEYLKFPRLYPESEAVELMPDTVVLGQPYRGMVFAIRGGKIIVALGSGTYELDRVDVDRVRRWEQKRPTEAEVAAGKKFRRVEPGDIIPVRVEEREIGLPRQQWAGRGEGKKKRKISIVTLVETPTVQAALVALDPKNGEVRAMMGGYDYHWTQFNRATQAYRQAGSSIKPFVYTTAIENGHREIDKVADAPIAVQTAGGVWAPHNYKGDFAGVVTMRTALAKSLNTVSVRLTLEAGVPRVIETMHKMGLEKSKIPRHISISLGTPDVLPIEMTAAFATFPAGGRRVRPVFITKIKAHDGTILEETKTGLGEQVMRPETAYIMADMMKAVVVSGTGKKASELGRPAAGKTGTSNSFRDTWFVGYTTDLVCGVWVGRDNFKPIGGDTTGGNTAAPIWLDFMRAGHPATPVRDFEVPNGILFIRMNGASGERVRPGDYGSVLIPFRHGTVPKSYFDGTHDRFYDEETPASQPVDSASQPTSNPASQPASLPTTNPASAPASAPASQKED